MQTHKNPNLRAGGTVPPKPSVSVGTAKPFTAAKPVKAVTAPVTKKPPVFELQNKKWVVENQEGRQDLVITDTNLSQTVYAYKCNKSVITVKGKINSIILGMFLVLIYFFSYLALSWNLKVLVSDVVFYGIGTLCYCYS